MFNYLSTTKTTMIENKLNFLDDEVYLPEFLNTREKWVDCIRNTDNVHKFEEVIKKH